MHNSAKQVGEYMREKAKLERLRPPKTWAVKDWYRKEAARMEKEGQSLRSRKLGQVGRSRRTVVTVYLQDQGKHT
jgi:hypothetical protein